MDEALKSAQWPKSEREIVLVFHQSGLSIISARLIAPGSRLVGFGPTMVVVFTRLMAASAWNHRGHMSYTAQVVKVMIASPSDVPRERQLIRDVIHEWNAVHAEDRKVVLMPVGWETHAAPDMGDRPQAIINRQLLKTCDLLVAVFWTRLGSPTGVAASGTVEEINEHLDSGKPAMIYFSTEPVRMNSVDGEQYGKLRAFKEDLRSRGLFDEYEDLTTFRTKFARHLAQRSPLRTKSSVRLTMIPGPCSVCSMVVLSRAGAAACPLPCKAIWVSGR
jgi:hypothetical protein